MKKGALILLIFILLIATFFRLWQLNSIPPGLYPDEAINGNETITLPGKVFYPENNGREGLFINLLGISFSIFGTSIWALRIVPAIIGILTVFGLFLLTKELFVQATSDRRQATRIALFSSFFLAISFWHTNFSRIGFRAILTPFILIFSFYYLFKGFKNRTISNFILAGFLFGLGFYTYTSFRLAVILLAIVLVLWWFIYKKENLDKKYLSLVAYFLFLVFIVALPIGIYFLQNPQDFLGRITGVSIFTKENVLSTFKTNLIYHMEMFNFYGDSNWRHNISGAPVLFWPVGIFFLIGFFLSIKELFSSKNRFMFHVSCFMSSWFFIMLLPAILTYEGIPHSLRSIGSIPPTFIFAGMGIEFLRQQIEKRVKINKFLFLTIFLFFISLILAQYWRYFIIWGQNPEVGDAFSKNYVQIGNYLNSLSTGVKKYVIVNQSGLPVPWPAGIPMPAQTVIFIENTKYGRPQSTYLLPEDLDKIKINKEPTIIIPLHYDKTLFQSLKNIFPEGKIEKSQEIFIYKVNP